MFLHKLLIVRLPISSPKTTKQTKVHKREKRQKLIADIFPNK